jgi:hypothetical protein
MITRNGATRFVLIELRAPLIVLSFLLPRSMFHYRRTPSPGATPWSQGEDEEKVRIRELTRG